MFFFDPNVPIVFDEQSLMFFQEIAKGQYIADSNCRKKKEQL